MVDFQIVSDLHIENLYETPSALKYIVPAADILIMAGDIGHIHRYEQLKAFLKDICGYFEDVLYVLGNHEYYIEKGMDAKTMEELYEDVLAIKAEIPNLHILNKSALVIGNVCVVGCTLWSKAAINIPPFMVRIRGIYTDKYNALFEDELQYIETMIKYCKSKELKLLVVTHHCPSYLLVNSDYKYNSLYASNLDHLLTGDSVHTWVCGHTHVNFDFITCQGTRLVSNQKGKPRDKTKNFVLNRVITV